MLNSDWMEFKTMNNNEERNRIDIGRNEGGRQTGRQTKRDTETAKAREPVGERGKTSTALMSCVYVGVRKHVCVLLCVCVRCVPGIVVHLFVVSVSSVPL